MTRVFSDTVQDQFGTTVANARMDESRAGGCGLGPLPWYTGCDGVGYDYWIRSLPAPCGQVPRPICEDTQTLPLSGRGVCVLTCNRKDWDKVLPDIEYSRGQRQWRW